MNKKLAALVAAFLILAACGGGSSKTSASSSSGASGASAASAQRIVSMSPTATEMLFAIGAGKQVVAVDDQSNFPDGVPKTDLSAYEPNAEAIAGYHPDLVVISDDTKNLKSQLETLKIPVAVEPAATTLDDSYRQIEELGDKTGHRGEADKLVSSMKQQITDLTKDLPARPAPLTYYHELDNTLFTVTSKTFIGQLYSLAGLTNVADPADANGHGGSRTFRLDRPSAAEISGRRVWDRTARPRRDRDLLLAEVRRSRSSRDGRARTCRSRRGHADGRLREGRAPRARRGSKPLRNECAVSE